MMNVVSASPTMRNLLAILGLVVVGRGLLGITMGAFRSMRVFVWARLFQGDLVKMYGGKWAVVTGCTDGIGKEYARQLARRGMNILLISRNIDKLKDVQQLIKSESPGVETEAVQVDFSHGRVVYPKIATSLQGKDIGILVNNVGMVFEIPKKFLEGTENELCDLVNLNVGAVVLLSHLVLKDMVTRGKGAIINVSSILSGCPTPYEGMYAATKVFIDFFSQSLCWECGDSGVTIQTLRPGFVATKMTRHIKYAKTPSLFIPSASTYVSSALPTLGHASRTTGYWPHTLQIYFTENLCSQWVNMSFSEWFLIHSTKDAVKEMYTGA